MSKDIQTKIENGIALVAIASVAFCVYQFVARERYLPTPTKPNSGLSSLDSNSYLRGPSDQVDFCSDAKVVRNGSGYELEVSSCLDD